MISQSCESRAGSIRIGAFTSRLLAGLVLISTSFAAWAVPQITSYDPPTVEPEGIVWIHGARLREIADANVCWGVAGRADTLGTIARGAPNILSWDDRTIRLRLPESLTAATYWIGVCQGGRLRSNRMETLRVAGVASAPVVTGYNPSNVAPGGRVLVHGRRFGTTRTGGTRIRFGTSLRPEGDAEVLRWSDSEIEVRLPAGMRSGTYWLAIYQVNDLLSNLNKNLRVGSAEEMTLNPVRLGTTLVNRLDRNNDVYCGLDRRGLGGPAGWDRTQISVGGITNYNPGTPPLACWDWSHSSYQGAALIDLSPLIAADRPLPAHVELRFRQDGVPAAAPCGQVWVFGATADWTSGLDTVRGHTPGTAIGAAGRVGDRLSLPMTEYVRGLIENARGPESARRRYYGFLLNDNRSQRDPTAADSRRLNLTSSPTGCIGRYRDVSLYVRWER